MTIPTFDTDDAFLAALHAQGDDDRTARRQPPAATAGALTYLRRICNAVADESGHDPSRGPALGNAWGTAYHVAGNVYRGAAIPAEITAHLAKHGNDPNTAPILPGFLNAGKQAPAPKGANPTKRTTVTAATPPQKDPTMSTTTTTAAAPGDAPRNRVSGLFTPAALAGFRPPADPAATAAKPAAAKAYVTGREIMAETGWTYPTLRGAIGQGLCPKPAMETGGNLYFNHADVEAWRRQRRTNGN